ncbi:MAG: prepilin-type N-terminal cleavage/methylation domain-containing protein [Pseudomonadota bacterium]
MKRFLLPPKTMTGVTLLELLISIAILGIIVAGLQQVIGSAVSTYKVNKEKQELVSEAQYAMERMVMFVQETGKINSPVLDTPQVNTLEVSERVLDNYNNTSRAYVADGDGLLDTDHDSDGLIDENEDTGGSDDRREYIRWYVSSSSLMEEAPNYTTNSQTDKLAEYSICANVVNAADFKCNLFRDDHLSKTYNNLVCIELTLTKGQNTVTLKTRVKARMVE